MPAVERAAEAIRASAGGQLTPGGLRDVRLALLALPRDPNSVPEVEQRDMSEIVQILKCETQSADLMLTGLVLMRYLAQRQVNQKRMAATDCVSLVLQALQIHDSNPTLQGVACDTLGNLLQEEINTEQFLQQRGVDAVFRVINANMSHTRVMEAACFLLGNVASSEEGLKHIARNGGGKVALSVMKAHDKDPELLRELLFLTSNVAQSPQLQQELTDAGAVEAVLGVMQQHVASPELQAMACSAIDNLCSAPSKGTEGNNNNTNAYRPSDSAVKTIIQAVDRHCNDASVVRRGAGALATLASLKPALSSFIGKEETVQCLVEAGSSVLKGKQDNQAVIQVFRALESLADVKENKALLSREDGAVQLVMTLVNSSSPRPAPVARALAFIAKLCENDDMKQHHPQIKEDLGLEMVSSSLSHFWNHPSVVIPACTIMAALAKDTQEEETMNGHRSSMGENVDLWKRAMGGLLKAVRARPGDVAVAVSACVALAWLCERRVQPSTSEVGDLMGAFVMVMRAHPRDADVAEAACFMFSSVAKENSPAIRQQVIKSGAPLLVVMVLRHFSEAPGEVQPVLRRAVNAIRLVGLDDQATAGAVRLARAPEALKKIISRFPENASLSKSASTALNSIEQSASSGL